MCKLLNLVKEFTIFWIRLPDLAFFDLIKEKLEWLIFPQDLKFPDQTLWLGAVSTDNENGQQQNIIALANFNFRQIRQ